MNKAEPSTDRELACRSGRDEMNLAEFPITLLADRSPKGQKTLVFRDGERTLTVTGSDAYGLPTAADADVVVALIQLTKRANNFTDPTVSFTRYGLMRLLGWPNKGSSYRRLSRSLKCWTGVTLNYEKAWWDNKAKRKVDATFHILESVVVAENAPGVGEGGEHSASSFTWNRRFFESCRADNLKRLDLAAYFSLKSAVSKRMYRFLDKRFFHKPSLTFDLREFAHEHVGLGRNYADNGKLKEKLRPALEELERIGFLEPTVRDRRYARAGRGRWTITLAKSPGAEPAEGGRPAGAPSPLEAELVARGVAPLRARALAAKYPDDRIQRQLEHVGFIQARHPGAIRSLPGFLRTAIEEDYAAPPGFVGGAELARRQEQARAAGRARIADRTRRAEAEARERDAESRVTASLDALSTAELAELDREILADPEARESYDKQFPRLRRLFLELLRKGRMREKLGLPPGPGL